MNEEPLSENSTPEENTFSKGSKYRYINASKCKKLALEFAKTQIRTKGHTRVGSAFLLSCEAILKNHILSRVKMQPTKGKTLT